AEAAISSVLGSGLAGFSFLLFNLLCAPCFAAMGAIKREMNSPKWTAFAITYMCVFAYAVSFCVYQIGSFLTSPITPIGTVGFAISLAIIAFAVYMIARKPYGKKV
ncbi:MAG: ferrous iron transporter B, partial [Ruminococcaceae bacterium]|nr:ferrous iron transporter B [Oscillospiraceae bacterium]